VNVTPWANWSLRYALAAYAVTLALGEALALLLSNSTLQLGIGVLLIDAALLATLIPLYRRGLLSWRVLGLRTSPPAPAVGLVFLALLAVGLFTTFWVHVVARAPATTALNESTVGIVVTGFATALCAPVVEEIFFRGLLYGALRNRLPLVPAVLIGGVLFGAVHATTYPLSTLPGKAVFGVVACLLYERSGSLLPGIALHVYIDALAFEDAVTGRGSIVVIIFAGLGVALLIYAAIRSRTRARSTPDETPVDRATARQSLDQPVLTE